MALKVQPNELDGWDVVREDEGTALSNHPTREGAENAARMRAEEEHIAESGGEAVVVDPDHVHEIDDTRTGVKPAFLSLGAMLVLVTALVVIVAIIGAVTGFGS